MPEAKKAPKAQKAPKDKKPSGGKLTVKQVRSGIGRPETQLRTLRALGLRYHQQVTEVSDTPAVRGMLFQVRHLVEIQN
jgi:large subunit ribosomal protein L30